MNLNKLTEKTLALAGTSSFIVAVFFLAPRAIAIPLAILVLVLAGAAYFLKDRWL